MNNWNYLVSKWHNSQLVKKNLVTKQHFDEEVTKLNERIDNQDTKIQNIDEKITKVEKDLPDTIYEELQEQEKCKRNIILFGFREEDQTIDKVSRFSKEKDNVNILINDLSDFHLLGEGNLKISLRRLGKFNATAEKPRPLKVTFSSHYIREQVLSCCKNLKGKEQWKGVTIVPDLTKVQQRLAKKKRAELQTEINKKNNDRNANETQQFEYKLFGNYGFGNLRIGRVDITNNRLNEESEGQQNKFITVQCMSVV